MPEPVYRIKPLVWEGKSGILFAKTGITIYMVSGREWSTSLAGDGYRWAKSKEAAKAACESDYRQRLLQCLEVVK